MAHDEVNVATEEMPIDTASLAPRGVPCVACGAPVDATDSFCSACGCPRKEQQQEAEEAREDASPAKQTRFRCKNCGSEVTTAQDQRSYVCAFCDSSYVTTFDARETGRQEPEFVIGFAVTHEAALEKFQDWIAKNRWFRPGDLRNVKVADKLRGVYLPFWAFSMLALSRWSARIGEYWYRNETFTTTDSKGRTVTRTRRVRETEWWPLEGRHHRYYSGYLVSGSAGLKQGEAQRIKPFNLPALQRYHPRFLAGWMCEEYSVSRDDALTRCTDEFHSRENRHIAAFMPGDTHRDLSVQTEFEHVNSDLCLLPIYILSYRYRDRIYRFMVNGQTGKTAGDKPVSAWRVALAIMAVILLVAIVGVIFAVLSASM